MKKSEILNSGRRQFLSKTVPVCAATCFGASQIFAKTREISEPPLQQDKHPFDQEYKSSRGPLTYRRFFGLRYGEFIRFAMAMEKETGKDKFIEILKKNVTERFLNLGKNEAKRAPDNSLNSFVGKFRGGYKNSLVKTIVEDTEKVFELKVTDCIWAATFLRAKAGDIGFAHICHGDYAWPQGFNKDIKMIRDKTLMEGHDCCNHRYVWSA